MESFDAKRGGTAAPPDHSGAAIVARDLVKTYPKGTRALDGLTFSVRRGAVFGLLGPNGAGKSTAIKILTSLSRPDSGSAMVAGIDVLANPQAVRRAIGCVAQRSSVDMPSTGRENLTLQGQLYDLAGQDLKSRASELLERFHLTEAADRVARTYSGGMQRKLDIAMGLIHRPQVLFLDEPTTGLDPEARADMWNEIARLSKEGLTILLTTHYLEEADRLAERLAIIDRGRVVVEGTPEDLKAELKGDSVSIDLFEAADEATVRRAADRTGQVTQVIVDGKTVHARVDHGASALPALLGALESEGVKAESVRLSRPSLDDVYLRYTGRTFEQAEAAQQQAPHGRWGA
jgi:ABC-2 type transport system ATP-binding protein